MTDLEITLQNLQKVYEELPILAEKMPEIRVEFDMGYFGCYLFLTREDLTECSTVGCGLGNAARLWHEELGDPKYYDYNEEFDYDQFGVDKFPFLYNLVQWQKFNWHFLFSGAWIEYQPTFDQFIERVKYFLDKKGEIGEWKYQEESFVA